MSDDLPNLPLKQMLMAIMAISVYPVYPHLAVQVSVLLEGQHTAASAAPTKDGTRGALADVVT